MADVQKYFEKFHDTIRIDYEMDSTLREKRDIILTRIREHLSEKRLPGFTPLHQGSYKMRTGVKPIGSIEFDIDVGLRFNLTRSEHASNDVRQWVLDAVAGHTKRVESKGPCVRVGYADGFHADLVLYACEQTLGKDMLFLAHRDNGWRPTDPIALLEYVDEARSRFSDTEDNATSTDQLRRTVRCLKRWYDNAIKADSPEKPSGLAYTLLAISHARKELSWDGRPCDLLAITHVAHYLASGAGRPSAQKPTPEHEDLLARLTDEAVTKLRHRANELSTALSEAEQTADPVAACKALRRVFGDDFPVPDPGTTGEKQKSPAIITSSSSA